MVFLFTDMVSSSVLYHNLGNAPMYALVQRHFEVLGKIVEEHNGSVIKTVGDCVMAAFDLPEDATRAAVACVHAAHQISYTSPRGNARTLQLRAGVHVGPCLAINSSRGAIDYFGSTVNTAAHVQSCAGAGEVILTSFVTRTTGVKQYLHELEGKCTGRNEELTIKGLAAPLPVTRLIVVPSS
jgi:class 3 adenylate cyclase